MNNKNTQSEYLTIPEVCEIMHLGRTTVARLCKNKDFPCIKIGTTYRIHKESFFKWLSENMGGTIKTTDDDKEN